MNFKDFLNQKCINVFGHKKCWCCQGSDGHCDKCDDYGNLYQRDWSKPNRKPKYFE